jgi:sulfur transfer complex TusBCD TusB component (DsrH family)
MVRLEESSMFYRDLLVGISTLLAYAPFTETEVEAISVSLSKNQNLLLLQNFVLSTLQIGSKFIAQILR